MAQIFLGKTITLFALVFKNFLSIKALEMFGIL